MKKIAAFAGIVLISLSVSGQEISYSLMKARALIEKGKADDAIRGLDQALLAASDYSLYLERARAFEQNGDYSSAIRDCNEAGRLSSGSGEYELARIYALKGDSKTALYHLELNLGSDFRKAEKEIMLDPAFGVIENTREWKSFWRTERYNGLEKKVSEIEFYTSTGRTADAIDALNEMKSNYSNTDELAYSEALVHISEGRPAEALKVLVPLTAEGQSGKYVRLLARAQEGTSNFAGASATYSRLLESGLAEASLLKSRAECYRKTGEFDKALADITMYLELYPDDRNALSFAGRTEAVSGDNLKALQYFSRNLELHPNDADCYAERGNSYLNSGSWDRAVKDYTMSLDLRPGNAEAWLNKGVALLSSLKIQDACHDFRKALSLGNKKASEYINRNCIR